jgi:hypothetical protein
MKAGILRVSHAMIIEALRLPPDTVIDCLQTFWDEVDMIGFRIRSETLPETDFGDALPRVIPQYKSERKSESDAWVTEFDKWRY